MSDKTIFYKKKPTDVIFWVDNRPTRGEFLFSFDGKNVYNLFKDYPRNMTSKEVRIFDKENPQWAAYFSDRKR